MDRKVPNPKQMIVRVLDRFFPQVSHHYKLEITQLRFWLKAEERLGGASQPQRR